MNLLMNVLRSPGLTLTDGNLQNSPLPSLFSQQGNSMSPILGTLDTGTVCCLKTEDQNNPSLVSLGSLTNSFASKILSLPLRPHLGVLRTD